jgi:hypothetical protein
VPQWPTTNVTLIGDAIHTMTPGRGVGANTPVAGPAMRTMMRIINHIPAAKNAMARSERAARGHDRQD